MKIRMKSLCAGPSGVMIAGQEYDVSNEQAEELIRGGYAVRVGGVPAVAIETPKAVEHAVTPVIETAVLPEPENAMVKKPARRK
jgi:hypothetical protein